MLQRFAIKTKTFTKLYSKRERLYEIKLEPFVDRLEALEHIQSTNDMSLCQESS